MSVKHHQPINNNEAVASPCIRNCCLDEQDVCLGCYRHMDEIMAWQQLNVKAKQAVLDQCQLRKQQRGK